MNQPARFLPYGRQSISKDDIRAVNAVLRSDYLTTGPEIERFESAFCAYTTAQHAIACNSATAALHLALSGLGIGPGDACIVPSITFLATANAALYCGADVIFADVDTETGLLTLEALQAAIERSEGRVRAVLPVHLAGAVCDMPRIAELARKHDLKIVEDACHALGGQAFDHPVGACTFSDAATFSFHPVKTLACGEGGMVVTNHDGLSQHMREARSHGVTRDTRRFEGQNAALEPWRYEMQTLGWNYRMPDINAALGRSQLARLDQFVQRRRDLCAGYNAAFAPYGDLVRTPKTIPSVHPCRHLYNISIDFKALGVSRASVMAHLKDRGIGTQVHYIPVHTQPFYRARYGELSLPGAEAYYANTLSLPLYPDMQDDDPDFVAAELIKILKS